jgi:CspA family cold shock protein
VKEKGKVKTLTDKGFGFISVDGKKKDLFFHSSQLQNIRYDDLQVGDDVEFEVGEGPKGPCALNVSLVEN